VVATRCSEEEYEMADVEKQPKTAPVSIRSARSSTDVFPLGKYSSR